MAGLDLELVGFGDLAGLGWLGDLLVLCIWLGWAGVLLGFEYLVGLDIWLGWVVHLVGWEI